MLKGAIHVHSTYSDGEFTLAELRELFLKEGCQFLCMTDHAEAFDEAKLRAYVDECRALSDDRFRFIAGLEHECEQRMHVLSFGAAQLSDTINPQEVIQRVADNGGLSVIAHPMDQAFPWIETFDTLPDGIETWNSKYDGRYAPRTRTFDLLQRLKERRPKMNAFYGVDLHWKLQYRGLFTHVDCLVPTDSEILAAFVSGRFRGVRDGQELPSDGHLLDGVKTDFERARAKSDRFRRIVKSLKNVLKQTGMKVPAPIKAQLRRFF